jgi:nucleoside-diphosphate-sugar epimerase
MHVLVTGASGCIGAWAVKQLVERGAEVTAFDLDASLARLRLVAPESITAKVRVETGAVEDTERMKALVRERGVTHILHLAALQMPMCQANPVQGALVNVIGTLNVFEAARDAGREVRIVYASSAAVWGPPEEYGDQPLTEEDPLRPATFYGIYKQSNEGCARVFHKNNGLASMGLRPWTVYGVGRDRGLTSDPTFAIKAVAMGAPFTIRLSGSMDLQYVEDVAASFVACLESRADGAHIFNLAGDVVKIEEIIERLERLRPGAAKLLTFKGPQVPVAWRMDDAALRALVPGIPRTPLDEGLARTLEIFERLKAEGRLDPSLPT